MSWRLIDMSQLECWREVDGSFFGKDEPAKLLDQLLHINKDYRPYSLSQSSLIFRELFFVETVFKVLRAHPTKDFTDESFLKRLTKALSKDRTAARLNKEHGLDVARAVARVVKKMCDSRTMFENRPPPPPTLAEPTDTGAAKTQTKAQCALDARALVDKLKLQETIDKIILILEEKHVLFGQGARKLEDIFAGGQRREEALNS
ncbi:hypothetical protein K4K54_010883 [Colletotrichum sp. SAR 10_86]|nr:hypothetical protein KHU50_011284 [Colletotrichum sp. SAR 10_65]KAI8214084.1 hypothetical protein K4K52_002368 [Colletotrichum sp. SAR 10_76]KAI8233144.1 hypothetical protein K4K54_010883 [Colletotrichum sp. SAR 10_86]